MALINPATREITGKIVYYGPGLCGKTTNLQYIYENVDEEQRGKMLSLATDTDRTLFFDFLPMDLGKVRGFRVRIQLYTVPGQVFYQETRKRVLKGADGVVFVADSQRALMPANEESLKELRQHLLENGLDPNSIPLVLQYNKRDLRDIFSVEEMDTALNPKNVPFFEAVAKEGVGVEDTLKAASRLVLKKLMGMKPEAQPTREDLLKQAMPPARIPPPRVAIDERKLLSELGVIAPPGPRSTAASSEGLFEDEEEILLAPEESGEQSLLASSESPLSLGEEPVLLDSGGPELSREVEPASDSEPSLTLSDEDIVEAEEPEPSLLESDGEPLGAEEPEPSLLETGGEPLGTPEPEPSLLGTGGEPLGAEEREPSLLEASVEPVGAEEPEPSPLEAGGGLVGVEEPEPSLLETGGDLVGMEEPEPSLLETGGDLIGMEEPEPSGPISGEALVPVEEPEPSPVPEEVQAGAEAEVPREAQPGSEEGQTLPGTLALRPGEPLNVEIRIGGKAYRLVISLEENQ